MLKTSTRRLGNVVVVDCHGRIVMSEETASLRQQVKSLLEQSQQIVLNLAAVDYIDSSGLGTLVGLYTSARDMDGEVKLAGVGGRVKDVLHVTNLDTIFDTYNTAEQAAASFRASVMKRAS